MTKLRFYRCIGASDRIFDHCLSRSSAPTIPDVTHISFRPYIGCARKVERSDSNTPFNLVPIGSPALFIKTHALSSNFTTLPSGLCSFFAVRTTTACRRSPLRTLFAADVETVPPGPVSGPKERCFWTTMMMRSPTGCQQVVMDGLEGHINVGRTNLGMSFHSKDGNTFDHSSAGIVDAVQHRLRRKYISHRSLCIDRHYLLPLVVSSW